MASKLYHTDHVDPGGPGPSGTSGGGVRIEDDDVPERPVEPTLIETVADHELVGNCEADVVDGDLDLPSRHLVEEDAGGEALGVAGRQVSAQVGQGAPRV